MTQISYWLRHCSNFSGTPTQDLSRLVGTQRSDQVMDRVPYVIEATIVEVDGVPVIRRFNRVGAEVAN